MISMGQIKNEAGFIDTDALMARKLYEISGHDVDCTMNWQTDDETERWTVVFWWGPRGNLREHSDDEGWYRVDDESLFSCLWRALIEYGETNESLSNEANKMMTEHHAKLRERYREIDAERKARRNAS